MGDEKACDPLMKAKVKRTIDGTIFSGHVTDIEQGRVTRERLYLVRYSDGDVEHYTANMVRKFMVERSVESLPKRSHLRTKPPVTKTVRNAFFGKFTQKVRTKLRRK